MMQWSAQWRSRRISGSARATLIVAATLCALGACSAKDSNPEWAMVAETADGDTVWLNMREVVTTDDGRIRLWARWTVQSVTAADSAMKMDSGMNADSTSHEAETAQEVLPGRRESMLLELDCRRKLYRMKEAGDHSVFTDADTWLVPAPETIAPSLLSAGCARGS